MERRSSEAIHGRGATANPTGRFEAERVLPFDDGWSDEEVLPAPLQTVVQEELSRSILSSNRSPDVPFDRSLNPYRGCEHGCIYCFARPTHAFLGLSPGLDFETRLFAKPGAAALLRRELGRASYRPAVIALGANTDPYQPVERDREITRSVLEVMVEFGQPVTIITKSSLVLRDLDLLVELARKNLARVLLSVTTLDPGLARHLEPRASTPARRLRAVERLAGAGVPTGVLVAPVIPALTECELESILAAAAEAGAHSAGYILLRLPGEVAPLFEAWLREHHPERAERVLSAVRSTRAGELNSSSFGERMRGSGPVAELLEKRFSLATRRLGLSEGRTPLSLDSFAVPRPDRRQLGLFGGLSSSPASTAGPGARERSRPGVGSGPPAPPRSVGSLGSAPG